MIRCKVKARIPFSNNELPFYIYLFEFEKKEHLAIVYGKPILSKSLEQKQPQETNEDRLIRGCVSESNDVLNLDVNGDFMIPRNALVRIHSACFTGETLGSTRCDCGIQLKQSFNEIISEGFGIVLYLNQEGRDIGLEDKLRSYNLQDNGYDTCTANRKLNHPIDRRDYKCASEILKDFSIE
jgi:GTP cyclohydrolase II